MALYRKALRFGWKQVLGDICRLMSTNCNVYKTCCLNCYRSICYAFRKNKEQKKNQLNALNIAAHELHATHSLSVASLLIN